MIPGMTFLGLALPDWVHTGAILFNKFGLTVLASDIIPTEYLAM